LAVEREKLDASQFKCAMARQPPGAAAGGYFPLPVANFHLWRKVCIIDFALDTTVLMRQNEPVQL
jgi:hypothetical protein